MVFMDTAFSGVQPRLILWYTVSHLTPAASAMALNSLSCSRVYVIEKRPPPERGLNALDHLEEIAGGVD